MPTINVNDAYVLNETGAEVDKVTGLFTKNENATTGEKQMARLNIAAGGSNRNLLDNAYFVGGGSQLGDGVFPINQRGQASYSGWGNHFDRWRGETNYPSITLAADGVKFCSTTLGQWGTMVQYLAKECVIAGKTVTISAIIDGTLASTTYSIPASGGYDLPPATVGDISFNLYSPNGTDIQFRFYTTTATAHTIAAAKLEFGTVSTLANDPIPDFGEELRKCQRYLWVHKFAAYDVVGNGYAVSATVGGFAMYLPVSMRTGGNPQATYTTLPSAYGGGSASNLSTMNLASLTGNIARYYVEFSGIPANNSICVMATTDTTITISNEL